AFTERGVQLGNRIAAEFGECMTLTRCAPEGLSDWTRERFFDADALLFIGASGIAVRAIAPHIESKLTDPAVVVMDECGEYCIPLLSGHVGGANDLAIRLAKMVGARPVITTATDVNHLFAIDCWAVKQGLRIVNAEAIKHVSGKLLKGESVTIKSLFPILGTIPVGVALDDQNYDVLITYKTRGRPDALRLIAPVITLGIGCKKSVSVDAIEEAFAAMLGKSGCHPDAVRRVCSITLKNNEAGILEFCRRRKLPFTTFTAEQLMAVEGSFAASAFVKSVTGADNVCERSAVLGSDGGVLLTGKNAGNGVTMAMAIKQPVYQF
ncbi:MAG: cobalamin biosynthesis protein, partial [Clostridia bacterium]